MTNNSFFENVKLFFEDKYTFLQENPKYGLLVAAGLVVIYIVGLIADWRWVLDPSGASDMVNRWIEIFGRRTIRFWYGIGAVILLICLLYIFFKM